MEVFVSFFSDHEAPAVLKTVEAWEACEKVEPIVVQLKKSKFEIERRIVADNMAKGKWYILADVGCMPTSENIVHLINQRLSADVGMYGFGDVYPPRGVRVCQKGVVQKWLERRTNSYDKEHALSVVGSGKKVESWSDITYKAPLAC